MSVNAETLVTFNDETRTLQQWAAYYGYEYKMMYSRYKRGLRGADLFRQPRVYKQKRVHEYSLPKNLTRREALLGALDDYHRDSVLHYSKQFDMSEIEFVNTCLENAYKKIQTKSR